MNQCLNELKADQSEDGEEETPKTDRSTGNHWQMVGQGSNDVAWQLNPVPGGKLLPTTVTFHLLGRAGQGTTSH